LFDPKLEQGQELSNDELCRIFKCGSRGGMRRSIRTNTLVLVADHTKSFYEDRWKGDVFHYTGMGLTGNQSLSFSQNKTLAESDKNGVDVFLFEVFERGRYMFQGRIKLSAEPYRETQSDFEGNKRTVLVFPLKLIEVEHPAIIPEDKFQKKEEVREKQARKLSNEELLKRISILHPKKATQKIVSDRYIRDHYVSEFVRRRANGRCQLCGNTAPFMDRMGRPYLEIHHIKWLSKGGRDGIDNAAALCPNCHRKMHILDLESDREYLLERVKLMLPED
jgi:5-methylcytosine-specific restriction protein A